MEKFKNWLIKKLGGLTHKEHYESISRLGKENFIEQVESRIRNGDVIAIVTTMDMRTLLVSPKLNSIIKVPGIVAINKQSFEIDGVLFKVYNHPDMLYKIRSINLRGYLVI